MRIRVGGNADAGAAIGVVHHVLFEHGLPFEPRLGDHELLAPDRYFKASGAGQVDTLDLGDAPARSSLAA